MRISLTHQIMGGVLVTALAFTAIFGFMGSSLLSSYLYKNAIAKLEKNATFMSERLEVGLWARAAELALVGNQIKSLDLKDLPSGKRAIEHLQSLVPQFSWIGVVNLEGDVVLATDDLLVGRNIAERPVFRESLKGHFAGDVHEAVLLDALLPKEDGEPLRFIDLGMHLLDSDGRPVAVLAAHLDWIWAKSIEKTVLSSDSVGDGIELVIVNRNHDIILATDSELLGQHFLFQPVSDHQSGSAMEVRGGSDEASYLVASALPVDQPIIANLGWRVFARQRADFAFKSGDEFIWTSLRWGSGVLALCLLMALVLGRQITKPIVSLTKSATLIAEGKLDSLSIVGGSSEMLSLGNSIRSLLARRDQLESSLVEQTQLLRAILNAAVDSIITIDDAGIIIAVNRSCERAFGYDEPELVGKNVKVLMPTPHREAHDGYIARYLSTGDARIIGIGREVPARRRDGSVFPAELSIGEVQLEGRRLFTGIIRDLTNNVILRHARDEAEAASRAKSQFLSAASHDLRQPVHALALLANALGRRPLSDEALELVLHIQSVVKSMQGMFDSLLDIARLEAGTYSANITNVNVGTLMASLFQEMTSDALEKNVRLRLVRPSVTVRADPVLLDRILRNLLSNAIKFAQGRKVLMGVRRVRGFARIIVADSGIGIPADEVESIFEEFRQLPDGKAAGGLGLGLAIARSVSRLMKSDLKVRSAKGKGTAFWLDLPIAQMHHAISDPPAFTSGKDTLNLSGLKILVADDDPQVLHAMHSIFAASGVKTLLASSKKEIVNQLALLPDFAVLDLQLDDEGTVIDLLDSLNSEGVIIPPTIIVTGATEAQAVSTLRLSGLPWLTKPVDPNALLAELHRVLRRDSH